MADALEELLRKYPDNNGWYFDEVSSNQIVTPELVSSIPNDGNKIEWQWNYLVTNPLFAPQFLIDRFDLSYLLSKYNLLSCNSALDIGFVEEHPDLPWDYINMSMCENISIDFIRRHQEKLHWDSVTANSAITMDIINQNLDLPWSWDILHYNEHLTTEFLIEHLEKKTFDIRVIHLEEVFSCPRIDLTTLKRYLDSKPEYSFIKEEFDWQALSYSSRFTWELCKQCVAEGKLDIIEIGSSESEVELIFTMEDMEENLEKKIVPWCKIISPLLDVDFIIKHRNLDWNWSELVLAFEDDKNLTKLFRNCMVEILDDSCSKLDWLRACSSKEQFALAAIDGSFGILLRSKYIYPEDIDNIIRHFNADLFSLAYYGVAIWDNPNITPKLVRKLRGHISKWYLSFANPNIRMDFVEECIAEEWFNTFDSDLSNAWNAVSRNPFITLEFIHKYHEKINFSMLSTNPFELYQVPNTYSKQTHQKIKDQLYVFEEELMAVSCHPNRYFTNCLDDENKRELGIQITTSCETSIFE